MNLMNLLLKTHPASLRKSDELAESSKQAVDFSVFMGIIHDFDTLIITNKLSEHDVFDFTQDLLENNANILCDFIDELMAFTRKHPLQPRIYLIIFNVLKFWAEKDEIKDAAYLLFQKRYSSLCEKLLEYYGDDLARIYDIERVKSFLDKKYVVKDPQQFLANFQKEAFKTMELVKDLHRQIESAIGNFNFPKETILFCDEFFIKSFSNLMGRCIVKRMEIISRPCHNKILDEGISCSINVFLRLIIEHDHEADTNGFEDPAKLGWSQPLASIKMEEKEDNDGRKYGVILAGTNSYYNQITISDFFEFEKLKKSIREGTEKIGVTHKS